MKNRNDVRTGAVELLINSFEFRVSSGRLWLPEIRICYRGATKRQCARLRQRPLVASRNAVSVLRYRCVQACIGIM